MGKSARVLCGWMLAAAGLMGGCGGGGGGGDQANVPRTSQLVPAAPALGPTLYSDAATLRPMIAGARWSYHGTDTPAPGVVPTEYDTETTQAASPEGTAESASNATNAGPSGNDITVAGGRISYAQQVDFAGKGVAEIVTFVELRSPVVQGDQYTIYDRHIADTAIDADGDGKPDALDVAIYAHVVGVETVSLTNLPSVAAVRVDTVVRSRVRASSNGELSAVVEGTISTWYAQGLGIVRQQWQVPTTRGDPEVFDERLVAWDGLTQGFGAAASTQAIFPSSVPAIGGQFVPGRVDFLGTATFDDHALLFSGNFGSLTVTGLDRRGNVLSAQQIGGAVGNPGAFAVVRQSDGALYLDLDNGAGRLRLTAFDTSGSMTSSGPGVTTIPLNSGRPAELILRFKAASDGTVLWVAWSRMYGTVSGFAYDLVMRPFDRNGGALAPEMVIDTRNADVGDVRLVAFADKALLSWLRPAGVNIFDAVYTTASTSGGASTHVLATGVPLLNLQPLQLGETAVLAWTQSTTGATLPHMAAVRLDASFEALRTAGSLDGEQLQDMLPFSSSSGAISALGERLAQFVQQPASGLGQVAVTWLDADALALPATPAHRVTTRGMAFPDSVAFAHIQWPDRVLVLAGSTQLQTQVVWLNAGPAAP